LTTNITCRDGQTILIGGLFRETNTDSRSQVPLLGDIPGIGAAFRNQRDTNSYEEVIILLTVHIVKDDDAYAAAGRQQLEDIERIRVGLRRGLAWHGRERLAQAHYQHALEHYANGDTRKALWNVRLALHNQPRLLPALKLQEEILNQRDWDDEGSVTRDFVANLIFQETNPGPPKARFDRPAPPFEHPGDLQGPEGFDAPESEPQPSDRTEQQP